jgi:F-type H+-transporting ATPase subunit delta
MLGASRTSLSEARQRLSELSSSAGADLGAVSSDLFGVADLLATELPLRRALADPSREAAARQGLLAQLLGDKVSPASQAFLSEVVGARWSRPRDLVDAVETLAVLASFEQALAGGSLDEVEDALFRFGRVVERESALRTALSDHSQPVAQRRGLLTGLLEGKVDPITLRVISAAVGASSQRRTVPETLDRFARLAAELRDRLNARVTSAVMLTEEQQSRMAAGLSRLFGKQIGLRIEVDPSLRGGLVVRVEGQILDASITRRLDIARRGLTAAH